MDQYEHLIPRYLRVAQSLKKKIIEGVYEPGDRMPPQHTLAGEYGVAFSTLHRALDLLESDGYVVRKVGVGTYASSPTDKSPRALVVDDDERVREFLAASLEQVGWKVTAAESGLRAIEEVEATDFDLIFLDLVMPGVNGIDAFRRIRALGVDAPVVIVTANGDSPLMSDALELGPVTAILKPLKREHIQAIIRPISRRTSQPTPILGGDSE